MALAADFDRQPMAPEVTETGYRLVHQDYGGDDFTGNRFRLHVSRHGPVAGFSMCF